MKQHKTAPGEFQFNPVALRKAKLYAILAFLSAKGLTVITDFKLTEFMKYITGFHHYVINNVESTQGRKLGRRLQCMFFLWSNMENTIRVVHLKVTLHNLPLLTLKVPNKNCSRQHFNFFTFTFRRK